jgi:HEAT repeat protein
MSALRALRDLELDAASVKVVMEQIESGAFTTAWLAADILGERRITAAVEPLRRALSSGDPLLAGKAMVNLVRIGDAESYAEIRRRFQTAEQVRVIMYGSKAIADMGMVEDVPMLLEKACTAALPQAVQDEVLISAARLCGAEDHYYSLIRRHGTNVDAAMHAAARDLPSFRDAWGRGDRCEALTVLERIASPADGCGEALASFLEQVDPACVDSRAALCLLVLAGAARV